MKGFFGDLFDMNHDGELDGFEQAADFAAFATLMDKMDVEDSDDDEESELEAAGLDVTDLEFMDDDD